VLHPDTIERKTLAKKTPVTIRMPGDDPKSPSARDMANVLSILGVGVLGVLTMFFTAEHV